MKFGSYEELMNRTLNQIAAIKSPDIIFDKRSFAHLLLDIYFDSLDIPDEKENRTEELRSIFKPMMDGPKLAPPPSFVERYKNYGK